MERLTILATGRCKGRRSRQRISGRCLAALLAAGLLTGCESHESGGVGTMTFDWGAGCPAADSAPDKEFIVDVPYLEVDDGSGNPILCPNEPVANSGCITLQRKDGDTRLKQKLTLRAVDKHGSPLTDVKYRLWFSPFKKGSDDSSRGEIKNLKFDHDAPPPGAVFKYTIVDLDNTACPAVDPRIRVY